MTKAADIELAAVTKTYGTSTAVHAISLKIPAGTYCCLLGPSGCGKSTLLKILGGVYTPTGGRLLGTLALYNRPDFLVNLADQLWSCF